MFRRGPVELGVGGRFTDRFGGRVGSRFGDGTAHHRPSFRMLRLPGQHERRVCDRLVGSAGVGEECGDVSPKRQVVGCRTIADSRLAIRSS